ncbi:MAG: hypothetical protein DMG49_26550 [Acidobacteria bacterium]|nr:MAG: hypothetical protein DMG49_26550 [Acidobacteriota bacterium]
MDEPSESGCSADLRDYLAAERTFLGWIRPGLALMRFGFVVAVRPEGFEEGADFFVLIRRDVIHARSGCGLPAFPNRFL